MIVADKEASIKAAHEISNKLLSVINGSIKEFVGVDDPAENIYLAVHIVGSLAAKIAVALDSYGGIYDIKKLNHAAAIEWIHAIAQEHININGGKNK